MLTDIQQHSRSLLHRWRSSYLFNRHCCRRQSRLLVRLPLPLIAMSWLSFCLLTHKYAPNRTSFIVTCVFTFISAAVIAEICSSLPLAGSIYLWAAEAGGPKYGRLFGYVVAWWSTTAWTTFCASMFYSLILGGRRVDETSRLT
jgi:hypothetical protein